MKNLKIGIDIGGTNTEFGLVDEVGKILARGHVSTLEFSDAKKFAKNLSDKILKEKENFKGKHIISIGIGAPNGNINSGCIEFAPNLPWGDNVPLKKYFEEIFNVPVTVSNDANAAAVGEKMYGNASDSENFAVITLGTGLGSGIFVNGKLLIGNDGNAGELGHLSFVPGGRNCGCGRKGCLETYVSASGIKRTAFEFLSKYNIDSELRKYTFNNLDSRKITELAKKGDKLARKVCKHTAKMLGLAIADYYSIFSPEKIFLFGGLANAGDIILKPAIKNAKKHSMKIFRDKIKIEISGLKGADAAILGAAALTVN